VEGGRQDDFGGKILTSSELAHLEIAKNIEESVHDPGSRSKGDAVFVCTALRGNNGFQTGDRGQPAAAIDMW
jgi:hypothetical protein